MPRAIVQAAPVAVCLSFALLLVPLLVAPIPPMTDYPNHLARLWLLAHAANPPMPTIYKVVWDTLTNVGIDLIGTTLSGPFDYAVVAKMLTAAAILLPPVGGAVLWRVLHRRTHWWQASFGLLAWGVGLLDGFLNFQIGLGLALLATALDVAVVARRPFVAATIRIAAAFAILVVHPFGLVFYGLLLAGVALGPALAGAWRPRLWRLGTILATLSIPLLAYVLLTPRLPGLDSTGGLQAALADVEAGWRETAHEPLSKLAGLFVGIRSYSNLLDGLSLVCLLLPILAALASRRLTAHAGLLLAVAACLGCYAVSPMWLANTGWIDRRFAFMAPLALAAALHPELPPLPARVLATVLLAASVARTALVGVAWHARQADVASVARALDEVPPGRALFAVEHRIGRSDVPPLGRYLTVGEPTLRHMATLAIPWRRDFVPTLFADRGHQPVQVIPPWDELAAVTGGMLVSVDALAHPDGYRAAIARTPYLAHWRDRMDYVLVINADMPDVHGPFVPPPELELVTDQGFAELYRIRR